MHIAGIDDEMCVPGLQLRGDVERREGAAACQRLLVKLPTVPNLASDDMLSKMLKRVEHNLRVYRGDPQVLPQVGHLRAIN
jgi:hypothetical protein